MFHKENKIVTYLHVDQWEMTIAGDITEPTHSLQRVRGRLL